MRAERTVPGSATRAGDSGPGSGHGDPGAAPVSGAMGSTYGAGDVLPPLEIDITRTLIVAGAIASRDYQDVHHDAELAREKGSPDIFMNILTTNGLVGRYVTDHFGPAAVLRAVAIRLGAPNHPGDTMVMTGSIEKVDGDTVTVRILGTNKIGRHVMGTVTVTVPGPRTTAPASAPVSATSAPTSITVPTSASTPEPASAPESVSTPASGSVPVSSLASGKGSAEGGVS